MKDECVVNTDFEDSSRVGDWMTTYTGTKFFPFDPREEEILIEDIVQGLSLSCRYSGQVNKFYSVAQHCVILSDIVEHDDKLAALLHDAAEAYIADIPRPIKWYLEEYNNIEKDILGVIFKKFNVPEMSEDIKFIDRNIVHDEAKVLFNYVPHWMKHYEEIGVKIIPWGSEKSKREFMKRFKKLTGE